MLCKSKYSLNIVVIQIVCEVECIRKVGNVIICYGFMNERGFFYIGKLIFVKLEWF